MSAPILINCAGLPDPVLIDLNEAWTDGLVCRPDGATRERIHRTRLHPSLTEPARMEALAQAREHELRACLLTMKGAA